MIHWILAHLIFLLKILIQKQELQKGIFLSELSYTQANVVCIKEYEWIPCNK